MHLSATLDKLKYRALPFYMFPRKIEAAAGPDDLPGPDDSDMSPAVPVVDADDEDGSESKDADDTYVSTPQPILDPFHAQ